MSPYIVISPQSGVAPVPLVCDSPHSGTFYPADFDHAVDRTALRKSEDTHVDTLWSGTAQVGGSLVCATFPRSYIDPNRGTSDVDVAMLDGEWPYPANPSLRCVAQGNGLVWRLTPEYLPIYSRLLRPDEVTHRINQYWKPYRQAVQQQLQVVAERFGGWCHLNLHSMPSNAYERLGRPAKPLADVVLGDLDGSSCAPELLDVVRQAFRARGHSVSVNDPYKGQDLIRQSGQPTSNRHSLQIELNRALYMDEVTREPNANFPALKTAIDLVLCDVASFVSCCLIRR
ncbi:MAG: N-formylglutamate amidohydrolase [Rhizobacter sp.]